jgi:putative IMPACT (imprinted ancient) family translation regulator
MEELSAVKVVIDKSRFFSHLYRLDNRDDIVEILRTHRKNYRKANHHCFAFIFEDQDGFKNDGEVGHPGQVLLEILRKGGFASHCLMVSRIFGGIKLGVGGVSRAFRLAGEGAVEEMRRSHP